MFKVDDYVMYGTTGVCKVIDIRKENFINNIEKDYYVLSHIYSNDTIIKIPVENEKINIRKIISYDEVTNLINDMPNKDMVWIEDERQRNEQFKSIVRTAKAEELIKVIKSVYLDKEHKNQLGKKSYINDVDIMKLAERLLNEEFATILNIPVEEVTSYILNNIPQTNDLI